MLQNHSRCRNGRGCGQHSPPDADGGPSSSEQETVDDSEEDRRFFADFEGQSVFDWEEVSVLSMYQESHERPWGLGGEDAICNRTEAWVLAGSAARHGKQDLEEECPNDDEPHRYRDEEDERDEGLRRLLEEMRRRDSEEGWPLPEQMAALGREDREDILQIMREEMGWSNPVKKTSERKKRSGVAKRRNTTMTKTRKEDSAQTPTTRKGRR
jgi:hypothetical protein